MAIFTYAWDSYAQYYSEYNNLTEAFINGSFGAKELIGEIGKDWNPVGYSKIIGDAQETKKPPTFSLKIPNGSVSLDNFGCRAFLIENLAITNIPGRVMIDFDQPETQRIPDLTGKFGRLDGANRIE